MNTLMTIPTTTSPTSSPAWEAYRLRMRALEDWIARVDADITSGVVADQADPLAEEALLRALFQRWATTLEGALDVQLELGGSGARAIAAAHRAAMNHRTRDWCVLNARAAHPVVVDLVRRQHLRMARAAGLAVRSEREVLDQVARVVSGLRPEQPARTPGLWGRARAALGVS